MTRRRGVQGGRPPAQNAVHLILRFVDVLLARPLSTQDRLAIEGWLAGSFERVAFFSQPRADQRHGYRAALSVEASEPGRRDLVRAALLHDIGKRHARLGPLGRVAATVAAWVRLPLRQSWRAYRDHGPRGAEELARAGAELVVIEFARHHHRARPLTLSAGDWELLIDADRARLRGR